MDQPQYRSLSPLANHLIATFIQEEKYHSEGKISVNPLISKFASLYEKLRNAMDYREEEVILRAAIERILKRRILILGGNGQTVAEPLVRELVWARYFPDDFLSSSVIEKVAAEITVHLSLRRHVLEQKALPEKTLNEWMYHLLSSTIARTLAPQKEKEIISNFMFQIMRDNIKIIDDTDQNRDIQTFIAVHKSYAKDDLAFLRYHLFTQYFGKLTEESLPHVSKAFMNGYKEIQSQLNYPRKDTVYSYVKKRTAVFLILSDVFRIHSTKLKDVVTNEQELRRAVFAACEERYKGIASRVRRAIVRSVIFILLTKTLFAFTVEGTVERIFYQAVNWQAIGINIAVPPIFMVLMGLFIKPPGRENSEQILKHISLLLFEDNPKFAKELKIAKEPPKNTPLLHVMFTLFWLLAFVLSFGTVAYVLSQLKFSHISMGVFVFFLTIVSFLAYRIAMKSREYSVEGKPNWKTPLIDFLFMPIIRVGQHLTEGIAQINIFMFILDFVIETPFKGMFGFFEQWFFFLHAKREGLD